MSATLLAQAKTSVSLSIPLFLESVQAGFPSPAQDYIERTLDLNELCIHHPAATFFVRVDGLSMIEAGIYSGDILVVDRSITPVHGHIVIACLNGEMTVKELCLTPRPCLVPRNKKFEIIEIPEGTELEIFGVVTTVIRNLLFKK